MFEEINRQLEEAQQEVFQYKKLSSMINELEQQKNSLESKAAELKTILDKEDIDVEKLEAKSLAHMFHAILGNLEEKKLKEQQEALAARLKYDQAVRDLEAAESEIARRITERKQYLGAEMNYRTLYDRKKEQLLGSGSETAQKIMDISEDINASRNMLKEIHEAVRAGNNVLSHLDNAISSLNSAEGWGTWDLLGGGLVSDMMKHSHIDDAKFEVEKVQIALNSFRTELADVKINSSVHIDTDGFGKFADFFFDGLIADWCMQSRIHDSQASVSNVKSDVQSVIHRLENMEQQLTNHVSEQDNEINSFIKNA
jgi:hypothetical protein